MTAPVSAGSVSTRMASSSDPGSWSARLIRSQKRDTGRKASLALTSGPPDDSCCWSTGGATREAKMSPGSSSTGRRLTVAVAAPVTMLVAPGPIEEVQAKVARRLRCLA